MASSNSSALSAKYDFLTVNEAAEIVGCTPQALREQIRSGALMAIKPCRDHLIPRDEFNAFMHERAMRKTKRASKMVDQLIDMAPSLSADQRAKLVAAL